MMKQRAAGPSHQTEFRTIPYDLLKEIAIAMAISLVLILGLSIFLSSPDVPSVTIQSWSKSDPVDFVTTANDELAGASTTATYGPPYNNGSDSVQSIGPISPQAWGGVHVNVDQPHDFVINPLKQAAGNDSQLSDAISSYEAASADQQGKWHDAYAKALADAKTANGQVTVASGDYGPVPTMLNRLAQLAQGGALDGLLLASNHFYQTDYTKP
ncbi:MAG TPA: cytochrome B6, partial [Candidatus Dormibacteraeota bacterium]|nr:cytochrome B6 [Candidatus Dormibacteraeota bacterium]